VAPAVTASRLPLWWLLGGVAAIAVAVGVVIAIVGGGGGGGDLFGGRATGAATPEEAVTEMIASLEAADPLGILAMVAPAERRLVADVYTTLIDGAVADGIIDDAQELFAAFDISVRDEQIRVSTLAEGLSWVWTPYAEVTARIDAEQVNRVLPGVRLDPKYDDEYEEYFEDVGLAAIEVDGLWYVSPLYTTAELARRDLGLAPRFALRPFRTEPGYDTPEDAVRALARAVASKDFTGIIGTLVDDEARLFADYEHSLGEEVLEEMYDLYLDVAVSPIEIERSRGTAIVEVSSWRVQASDPWGSWSIDGDDHCVEVGNDYGDTERSCFPPTNTGDYYDDDRETFFVAPIIDAGWRGARIVVVDTDDGWKVSLLQTAHDALLPFAAEPLSTYLGIAASTGGFSDATSRFLWDLLGETAPLTPGASTGAPIIGNDRFAAARVALTDRAEIRVVAGPDSSFCEVVIMRQDFRHDIDDYRMEGFSSCADASLGLYRWSDEPFESGNYLIVVWSATPLESVEIIASG